ATAADDQGALRVTLRDGELRVANTGAVLDAAGVTGLASLRASAKPEGAFGRFGVGFAAVLAVTDQPRVVSLSGGVEFSAARTRDALGISTEDVPVLRLPWPVAAEEPAVPRGYTTEVRLPLRDGIDGDSLLAGLLDQVPDVLLAFPALDTIDMAGDRWGRSVTGADVVELSGPGGASQRWLTHADPGSGYRWALPLDGAGRPEPLTADLLHAPTPTDEWLSLPVRLIASLPIQPSRRRVRPGERLNAALRHAAHGYVELLRRAPHEYRLSLVPPPELPRSEVDATLRDELATRLRDGAWLPCADGAVTSPAGASVLAPASPRLVTLLTDIVPGLLDASMCGDAAVATLVPLGARRVDIATVVDELSGIERTVSWWHDCYDVLLALLDAREVTVDDLGALPVPLADGRTVAGPRNSLIPDVAAPALDTLVAAGVVGLRLLHAEADHPLLRRLGAREVGAAELLTEPVVGEAVRASMAD